MEVVLPARGKCGLRPQDYFREGAWRPAPRLPERRGFVGQKASDALNLMLNPGMPDERPLTEDKLASRLLVAAAGLPQARLLAVAAGEPYGGDARWLRGPEETLAFLSDPHNLPCFGKPVHGSNGIGAVSVVAYEDANGPRLGNGQSVSAEELVAEISAEHARGYMFQELVQPHPDLARLVGSEVHCTVLRVPAPGVPVDSWAGPIEGLAAVGKVPGKILTLQDRREVGGIDSVASQVTGVAMAGKACRRFPRHWSLHAAHRCLPGWGIMGADIMVSDQGPLLNEMNGNPHHSLHQTGFACGLLGQDLPPSLDAVQSHWRGNASREQAGAAR